MNDSTSANAPTSANDIARTVTIVIFSAAIAFVLGISVGSVLLRTDPPVKVETVTKTVDKTPDSCVRAVTGLGQHLVSVAEILEAADAFDFQRATILAEQYERLLYLTEDGLTDDITHCKSSATVTE